MVNHWLCIKLYIFVVHAKLVRNICLFNSIHQRVFLDRIWKEVSRKTRLNIYPARANAYCHIFLNSSKCDFQYPNCSQKGCFEREKWKRHSIEFAAHKTNITFKLLFLLVKLIQKEHFQTKIHKSSSRCIKIPIDRVRSGRIIVLL